MDRANTNFAALKLVWLIIVVPSVKKNGYKEFKEAAVKLISEEEYSFAEAGRNLIENPDLRFAIHFQNPHFLTSIP